MHYPALSVLQCTIDTATFLTQVSVLLVVQISVQKIFLLNIEQWTNISLETRPQQPLTKCPGIEVTAKADLLWGNLKGCNVQDFPAEACVKEKKENLGLLCFYTPSNCSMFSQLNRVGMPSTRINL